MRREVRWNYHLWLKKWSTVRPVAAKVRFIFVFSLICFTRGVIFFFPNGAMFVVSVAADLCHLFRVLYVNFSLQTTPKFLFIFGFVQLTFGCFLAEVAAQVALLCDVANDYFELKQICGRNYVQLKKDRKEMDGHEVSRILVEEQEKLEKCS